MKTKLILGGLIALSGIASAQWTGSSPSPIWTNQAVGIGTSGPNDQLQVVATNNNGITVTQTNYGAASLTLDNVVTTGGGGGHKYILTSLGPQNPQGAGNFSIYDYTNAAAGGLGDRFFIQGSTGNVGIGSITPSSKLHVVGTSFGIRGDATSSAAAYAVQGVANGSSSSGQIIGVTGSGANGSQNFGGYFTGNGGTGQAFGVYGRVVNSTGSDWAGYFNGNVNIQGQAYCTASAWSSDRKLKSDIKPFANAMDKIALLKPSTYLFKTNEFKDMNLPKERQIGLIAQELEEVFPELVSTVAGTNIKDENGNFSTIADHKAVNYIGLIPVLISGLQQQQKQINEQKQLINQLMNEKTGNTTGLIAATNVLSGFAMEQNVPNPFTQETVINYNLPQTVSKAELVVYDLSGKQLASFPISERGAAAMTITSEKLSAGMYIYSIQADGKIVDSKRMVVAQK